MMKARKQSDPKGAIRHVEGLAWEGILRATVYFWNAVQQALNISNPRPYVTPSNPGEPPRKRTGFLAANVIYELNQKELKTRVGVLKNALYGLFLEFGTRRGLRPRPWLFATLKKVMPRLKALLKSQKAP